MSVSDHDDPQRLPVSPPGSVVLYGAPSMSNEEAIEKWGYAYVCLAHGPHVGRGKLGVRPNVVLCSNGTIDTLAMYAPCWREVTP